MKTKPILLSLFLSLVISISANALEAQSYAAGLVLGSQTALVGKMTYQDARAIDLGLGWSLSSKYDKLVLYSDHLWTKKSFFYIKEVPFDVYYGAGARIILESEEKKSSELYLGPRFPVGIKYFFDKPNIEVFSELAMIFNLLPSMQVGVDFGVGARYFF